MALILVTPPALEPVTLAEAKDHLRVDDSNSDALISELITAARLAAEKTTRRVLITQTWRLALDRFPGRPLPWWDGVREGADIQETSAEIEIPLPPLQSVTSLVTLDKNDAQTTFAASNYIVDTNREPGRIVLRSGKTWPAALRVADAIRITYVAGYGSDPGDVPAGIRQAILMLIGHLFENRSAVEPETSGVVFPLGVSALLNPYVIRRL